MIIGIVAVDRNGAIGKAGKLPWHYPADMRHFKETTIGHACVMGRKTWLTLKRPLVDRVNIVLSRQADVAVPEGVQLLSDVPSVLRLAGQLTGDLFVIGGEQVYRSFLNHIDRWIVTEVPLEVEGADAFVPQGFLQGFVPIKTKSLGEDLLVRYYDRNV